MTRVLKGGPIAAQITSELTQRVEALKAHDIRPCLALVRVGEREDDLAYERGALNRCAKAGIETRQFILPEDCTQQELLEVIEQVNNDTALHGCLMFRPLPGQLNEREACEALLPKKDVDCSTHESLYGVFACEDTGFAPCTAEACVELLERSQIELEGAQVCVVGRSLVVGKPVSIMLQARNATVTMCHTRTRDLPSVCRQADILVVCAGHIGTVDASCVHPEQTVIDVGINWNEAQGKLVGDVAFDEVAPIVRAITPVPGGVGSLTNAILASHVVTAAERALAGAIEWVPADAAE